MKTIEGFKEKRITVSSVFAFLLIIVFSFCSGCYIPGLGALPEGDDPPESDEVMGLEDTYFGKFNKYEVGGGKILTLKGAHVSYLVGDEVYNPDDDPKNTFRYNKYHRGMPTEVTFPYKLPDIKGEWSAAGYPEALVLDGELSLFYTNETNNWGPQGDWVDTPNNDEIGGVSTIGNTPASGDDANPEPIGINTYMKAYFNSPTDTDAFAFQVTQDNMLFRAKLQYKALTGGDKPINSDRAGEFHDVQLSLLDAAGNTVYDPAGNPLVSTRGIDYWKYRDPEFTFFIENQTGANEYYYLVVKDLLGKGSGDTKTDGYKLILESPTAGEQYKYIYKGEIQPARSGNPELDGGKTFEPDDLSTEITDIYPDCDGIPGTGDEGDAGVSGQCGSNTSWGAHDGVMQYQEVDDQSAIDDGEYFIGTPTNVGSVVGAEASIVRTPDRNSLLMFISYGDRIYMLESMDGEKGLTWDLSPIISNSPAVVPRQQRGGGDPEAPVISSGRFGFCETGPAPGDNWAAAELADGAASYGDTVPVMEGTEKVALEVTSPRGYPHTVAVTYGGNSHLDSKALKDELCASENCITSGSDGIINTYFAPRYISYEAVPEKGGPYGFENAKQDPAVIPGDVDYKVLSYPDWSGPGDPDNPAQYDTSGNTVTFLDGNTGASNLGGFLLGDDHWNTALFGNTTPPKYMQEQNCTFYEMGERFNQCALGAPIDPATGNEPVSILPGGDNVLNTVNINLRGDDYLCHEGSTVGICVGNNGVFDVPDFYKALEGDDRLEIVNDQPYDGVPDANPVLRVGIGPGSDGVLDTEKIAANSFGDPDQYVLTDEINADGDQAMGNFEGYVGADYYCETLDGRTAICPGTTEHKFSFYDPYPASWTVTGSRKLMSFYPLYVNCPEGILGGNALLPKKDIYSVYDDELCVIKGQIALCPGVNGYFQSYRLYSQNIVDQDESLFDLYDRVKDKIDKDCYSFVAETHKDNYSETEETRYVLYRYMGARFDDKLSWSAADGYFLTTGANGINQSCKAGDDRQVIGFNQGLPNVTIINGGTDTVLQTYPMKDEKVEYDRGIYKIMTGDDGVSNSYAMGDDKLELWMGTGAPDHPCVIASEDGVANTKAVWNDNQLYDAGDVTGFDAYSVWSPKAVVRNGNIWLYYSGLGYLEVPYATRPGAGDLGNLGECRRPGFDRIWGKEHSTGKDPYTLDNRRDYSAMKFSQYLVDEKFANAVDNGNGVLLAPRIGRVVSNMDRLRNNVRDWDYRNKPVMDLGNQCASSLDFPIDLPIEGGLPGLIPDPNYYGAFSPEIEITEAPDGESPLYLMFYSGIYVTEGEIRTQFNVGLARSLDGVNWQQMRDFNPVLTVPYFDIFLLASPSIWHGTPTVVRAGEDQYGEPAYQMFYNEFVPKMGDKPGVDFASVDVRLEDRINLANRRGRAYMFCSVGDGSWISEHEKVKGAVQVLIIALPLALFFGLRLAGRRKRA